MPLNRSLAINIADIDVDTEALVDDTVKGVLRSFGDAGPTPTNTPGTTLLYIANQARLRGININDNVRSLNADTGTQVVKSALANNTTVIIHTVTAAKDFYLRAWTIGVEASATDAGYYMAVRDVGDTELYNILRGILKTGTGGGIQAVSGSFDTPLKIPAGYDVVLYSSAVVNVHGFIHGWEE